MIIAKLNYDRIDQHALFQGKNGRYIDLVFFTNKGGKDQYGNDGFVAQGVSKEAKDRGERGPILGNWKEMGGGKPQSEPAAASTVAPASPSEDDDDVPF